MTVNYTTNLALGQPVTGTESGTWGDDVNNSITSYLDIAIAGGLAITITTADVTLTNTQGTSSATNIGSTTAQYAILNVSGAMTAARNLILPTLSRQYVINNNTTGGYALTVKGTATSGITMVNGESAHVYWNGSDYAKLSNAQGGAGSFTTLAATGNTSLATTPVLYGSDGAVSSGRLLGRYSYRNATPATAYFYDFNNSNTITSADSSAVGKIPTLIDSTITNANALTAFGTNYGTKAAGLSFVSGTASDVLAASVGTAPTLNTDINAVVVGYTTVGPRIAIQNYALNDDTANAISYVGAVHRFYPTGNAAVTISSTGLVVASTLSGGTSGTGYSFSGTAPATSLTLDSSGNVGIGTSSPAVRLDVQSAEGRVTVTSTTGTNASYYTAVNTGGSFVIGRDSSGGGLSGTAYAATLLSTGAYPMVFGTNSAERARIDSSGNLFVGATASPSGLYSVKTASVTTSSAAFYGVNNSSSSAYTLGLWNKATTGDRRLIGFYAGATETEVGYIIYNGTVTVYSTTSDYRLKTVIGAVTDAGQRIDALHPVEYTWNSNGQRTRGFLAHQFQEVYKDSVTGTKDAVNADGNPEYQAMQAGSAEVIADLVAEIQSLRKRLAAAGIA